jgi:hypothetical protein
MTNPFFVKNRKEKIEKEMNETKKKKLSQYSVIHYSFLLFFIEILCRSFVCMFDLQNGRNKQDNTIEILFPFAIISFFVVSRCSITLDGKTRKPISIEQKQQQHRACRRFLVVFFFFCFLLFGISNSNPSTFFNVVIVCLCVPYK